MTKKILIIISIIFVIIISRILYMRPDYFLRIFGENDYFYRIFGEKDDLANYCKNIYSIDHEYCPKGCIRQKSGGCDKKGCWTTRECIPLNKDIYKNK